MSGKRVCSLCGAEYDADQKFCPNDGSPLRSAELTDGLVGQIIAERYRVLSTLGEGGMGRVYLAEHVRMGRQCAVKVISPALASTDAAVARFNREAANASQINHPNVVQVYDFGEGPNNTLYLAMEFIEGETLSAIVRREGRLSVRRAATITKQVTDALTAAHHRGIVHRDLKPDNILVSRQPDGTEWVKVVDFGIAKTVQGDGAESRGGQTVTTAGISVGTPEYMSPEQLSGERVDTRSDLYSLGLVFFQLLTGDLPFPPGTSRENLIRRLTTAPRTLEDVRPEQDWPVDLQAVLNRALASEPDKRYPTAIEFGRDLNAIIAAAPAEPDVTVRLRSAGARPSAPTVVEGQVPPTGPRAAGAATTPAAARRKVGPVLAGVGAAALIVAGALYALNRPSVDAPPPAPVIAAADSVVSKPSAPEESTMSKQASATAPAETTLRKPVAQASTTPTPSVSKPESARVAAPAATSAPVVARLNALQRDVDGLISLGRQHVIEGNVVQARNEFRRAVQEVTKAVTLLPNDTVAARVRDSTARSLRAVVFQCQAAMQRRMLKITEPGFRCPSLVPARFLGIGRGRG